MQYLDEPIKVDPTGCKNVADLIEKTKLEFSPQLDSCPLAKLTLHRHSGEKLRAGQKVADLLEEKEFKNSDLAPLLIRHNYKFNSLRLNVIPRTASAYCAESIGNKEIVNAGVNGIFPTVNLPTVVCDATSNTVNNEDLVLPLKIIKKGLFFRMFCNKVP